MAMERLQKVLAAAGIASRRACETLIEQGRVTVDGAVVTRLGTRVDPALQEVRCDGEPVRTERKRYFLVNKPRGVVCSNDDEQGRPRVIDLLPHRNERLFTIGRLDLGTEGLIIVTNDGAFAQQVAHPRFGITKTYHARLGGFLSDAERDRLLQGVWIEGRQCCALAVKTLKRKPHESLVEVTMQEGRNREVRRMLAAVGHRVLHLRRIRIGDIQDDTLRAGKSRELTDAEIASLLRSGRPTPRAPAALPGPRADRRARRP